MGERSPMRIWNTYLARQKRGEQTTPQQIRGELERREKTRKWDFLLCER